MKWIKQYEEWTNLYFDRRIDCHECNIKESELNSIFINGDNSVNEDKKKYTSHIFENNEIIIDGKSDDPYKYKKVGSDFFFAKKGSDSWKKAKGEGLNAIKTKIFSKSDNVSSGTKQSNNLGGNPQSQSISISKMNSPNPTKIDSIYQNRLDIPTLNKNLGCIVDSTGNIFLETKPKIYSPNIKLFTPDFDIKISKINQNNIQGAVTKKNYTGETTTWKITDEILDKLAKFAEKPSKDEVEIGKVLHLGKNYPLYAEVNNQATTNKLN